MALPIGRSTGRRLSATAGALGNDRLEHRPGLAEKIKQAQDFRAFMAAYKDKVPASGISSIN